MWITADVDLPVEILQAHADGRLVLFVGAGASMDPPSGLPSFMRLARDLATAARVRFDNKAAIDAFLGSMPADFDVHTHAQAMIARPDSRPNPTHAAIVRLAAALGSPRIVTTNFDDHLAHAAAAESIEMGDKWVGPALPLGDKFTGIVHLHGSVLRPADELVLTDRDFGRAYLTDAWATRFLQKMFDEFTVLFVGYSHDDPIMRYLALGLPSKTCRYALTHRPLDSKWNHLGIVPVGYPGTDKDHRAALAALREWDRHAHMGRTDHRSRMQQIIEAGTSLTPVDADYLRHRLATVEGAGDFAQFASGTDWLHWAESFSGFRGLFTGTSESEATDVLSHWFAQTYVTDPSLHGAALQTVQRLGRRFTARLYESLSWATHELSKAEATAGRRWKALLATSVDGRSAPPDLQMLLPYEPDDHSEHLSLLRAALRPYLALTRRWLSLQDDPIVPPDAEVKWRADHEVLASHVLKTVDEADAGDPAVGAALEDALSAAYDLLAAYHGDERFDRLSSGRSAIEPHPQDDFPHSVDALIDGLREYGVKALPHVPNLPERWWSLRHGLFRRLALHLIDGASARSDDEKIRWVLDRNLLFAHAEKHEVYRVLASSLPGAGDDQRARLLAGVLQGPQYPDTLPDADRHSAYGTYNLLVWLNRADPAWEDAATALNQIQSANLTFGPRTFPDLDRWMTVDTPGSTLPIQPEDFIQVTENDIGQALDDLLARDYSERVLGQPTWDDARSVIRRVSEIRVDIGIRLWHLIDTRAELGTKADDLRRAITSGWKEADLGDHASTVMPLVATIVPLADSTRTVTSFLLAQIRKLLDSPESVAIATMRQTARTVWETHRQSFTHAESDPNFLALNSWPGDLADYWVTEISRRWREHKDDWTGLNELERQTLVSLLRGPEPTLDAIRPALAGGIYFLFAADATFARQNILPIFDDDTTAAAAWSAYLYHPRCDNRMLAEGLLQSLVAEWDRLDALTPHHLLSQFYELVASVLTFASIAPKDRQQLLDQSVLTANGAHAPQLARAIYQHLAAADAVDGAQVWEAWLRAHVSARLQGLPRTAHAEELARWADVAPLVGGHAKEAFTLLGGHGIGLGDDYHAPDWPAELLTKDGPELIAHLTERVQNSTPSGWSTPHVVRQVIAQLTEELGETTCRPLLDAAITRGFVAETR